MIDFDFVIVVFDFWKLFFMVLNTVFKSFIFPVKLEYSFEKCHHRWRLVNENRCGRDAVKIFSDFCAVEKKITSRPGRNRRTEVIGRTICSGRRTTRFTGRGTTNLRFIGGGTGRRRRLRTVDGKGHGSDVCSDRKLEQMIATDESVTVTADVHSHCCIDEKRLQKYDGWRMLLVW